MKADKIGRDLGFTIVELLVVIVVISVLAVITAVSYAGVSQKANVAAIWQQLSNNSSLLRLYNAENASYPTSLDSNYCPSAPVADTKYCLKNLNGAAMSYTGSVTTFKLEIAKGDLKYKITESGVIALGNLACPTGFIVVPGSATYNTNDFCVMKYEAKNDGAGKAVSQPNGLPWTNIKQANFENLAQGDVSDSAIITDGNTESSNYYYKTGPGLKSVTVDLGKIETIEAVRVWHYFADSRIYNNAKTEVSADGLSWETIFDSAISGTYKEFSTGSLHLFSARGVRYIRDSINGSNINVDSHWVEIQALATGSGGAIDVAKNACNGCRLMNEAEWMTIAQNVLSVPGNWSGGVVGSGYIYRGHTDNSPVGSIVASNSDTDGFFNTGNSLVSGAEEKRTLTLTNGEVIWDFAGNVWEWTSGQTTGGQPGAAGEANFDWKEWSSALTSGGLAVNPFPSSTGLAGASAWNKSNDVGQIYSYSSDLSLRGFIRGGYWGSSWNAGVLALNMYYSPSEAYNYIGFRVSSTGN